MAMAKPGPQKLTDRLIKNLTPDPGRRIEVPDIIVQSLYLLITPSGAKSWSVRYRHNRRSRKITLGSYPNITLSVARELAREALEQVARGNDPAQRQAGPKSDGAYPIEDVVKEFIEKHAKAKTKSWRETERIFHDLVLPTLYGKDLKAVARADIRAILDELLARDVPYMANRTWAAVRKFFSWAEEHEYIGASPLRAMSRPAQEFSRDRVLDADEIGTIWLGCDRLGYPWGDLFKLLILLGQRRGEIAAMSWTDIDSVKPEAKWLIPSSKTKNGKPHLVPLTDEALNILRKLPRTGESDLVLPGQRNGDKPLQGFSRAKTRLDEIVGISDWRLHDLRRSMASHLAEQRVPPHVIEKLLNHTSGTFGGVAGIYNQYGYTKEKRNALKKWNAFVLNAAR